MADLKRVLVVGNKLGAEETQTLANAGCILESVDATAEAAKTLASKQYDMVIVDPADLRFAIDAGKVEFDENSRHLSSEIEWQLAIAEIVTNCTEANLAYLDSDFNFVWVNQAYAEESGYTKEELIGRNHFDLFPDKENQQIFEMVRGTGLPYTVKEKPFVYKLQPERSITYWNWTLFPIRYGGDPVGTTRGFALTLVNVTEDVRIRQEIEQLRENAEYRAAEIETIMSSMTDGVLIIDTSGNIIWINQAGRQILGVSRDEPFDDWGNRFPFLGINGKQMSVEETAAYKVLQGEIIQDVSYTITTSSGKEVVLSVSASPVRDASGRIISVISVFRDISERMAFAKKQNDLLQRERRITNMLQQALIPPEVNYNITGCRVAVKYQPALLEAEVGGDFYDVFDLGLSKIGILIGDVAGKGLPAAIRVAAARYAIRSYAYLDPSPGRVMTLANEALSKDPSNGHGMLTAFFAVLDVNTKTVTYANGGHEPPLVLTTGGEIYEPDLLGRVLGVLGGYDYPEATLELRQGDAFILVTDGITEARPDATALFGREGIIKYLSENPGASLNEIPDGLLEAARAHAGGSLQDDAAIVAFELVDMAEA
ncbi:MAG: SpoIIE family protein phosphatase [Armatimonadota bacterium]